MHYVLCDKQINDLPQFGKINEILVVALVGNIPMVYLEMYLTRGVNNHLMCHQIARSHKFKMLPISNLIDYHPYSSHTYIDDGQLYIAMCSDVI